MSFLTFKVSFDSYLLIYTPAGNTGSMNSQVLKKNWIFQNFVLTSCTNVRYSKLYTCKRCAANLHKLFEGEQL